MLQLVNIKHWKVYICLEKLKKKTCQSKLEGVVHKPAIVRKIEGSSIYNDKCAKYGISSKTQRRHKI